MGLGNAYDRVIVAVGVDMRFDQIEGYNSSVVKDLPHAWKAGSAILNLRRQLEAMPDGGTVMICPPESPYRCPPGPYERASLIAYYLKQHKPRSKILIFDRKENFPKQPLFTAGWEWLYGHMIEWFPASAGGRILSIDANSMSVETDFGREKGNVINFIPAQRAGQFALDAGLVNETGWCPVNPKTFESTLQPGIHIIGDAAIAGAMPKSGFSASSQAKVTAAAVISLLNGNTPPDPSLSNICYSFLAPDYAISVAAVYSLSRGDIVKIEGSGGLSLANAEPSVRRAEALYAQGWYESITQDMFG